VARLWALAAIVGGGWGGGGCSQSTPHAEVTIIVGRGRDAVNLDPARVTDSESQEICEQVYDHLVRFRLTGGDPSGGDIEPALATSWQQSPDGKVWTFHLRKGVEFHDGTQFDADAVVFSFERQRDPRHPAHHKDFKYWENTFRNIERVEKVDRYTVRFTIERPYAPFLANLAMAPVSIVSPVHAVSGEGLVRHPIGTGPFKFVRWSSDGVVLRANPSYWGGRPRIDTLVYRTIPDPRQRLVALEGEAIHVAYGISPGDLPYVRLHPDLELHEAAPYNVAYIAMNTEPLPFDDVRVRRAVNHAVNKQPIVRLLYQGLGTPAIGALPQNMWGFEPNARQYPYDPQKARALLAEAGYDATRRPRFYVMREDRPYLPQPERVAEIVRKNLHEIGMEVEIVTNTFARHLEVTGAGAHDLAMRGWTSDNADPDNMLYFLLASENAHPGGQNVAFYRKAFVQGQLVWARESSDKSRREEYYRAAQRMIAEDAPWVPLAHARIPVAARRDLRGFRVAPSGSIYYLQAHRVR
jgi:peptide/nickel transport system substrate-binding protein